MSPRIAVTSGEPAGIGPELCLALARHSCAAHPVVLADRALLEGLSADQGDDEFDRTLNTSIEAIYRASLT